jgi:hypothetical protein
MQYVVSLTTCPLTAIDCRYVDHLHKEQRRLGGLLAATGAAEAEPATPSPGAAAGASPAGEHLPVRSSQSAGAAGRSGHCADFLHAAHPSYGELQLPAGTGARCGTGASSSSKQPGLVRAVSAAAAGVPLVGAAPHRAMISAAAGDARSPGAAGTSSPTGVAVPRTRVATAAAHTSVRWADQGSP